MESLDRGRAKDRHLKIRVSVNMALRICRDTRGEEAYIPLLEQDGDALPEVGLNNGLSLSQTRSQLGCQTFDVLSGLGEPTTKSLSSQRTELNPYIPTFVKILS